MEPVSNSRFDNQKLPLDENGDESIFANARDSMLKRIWTEIVPSVVSSHYLDRKLAHEASARVFLKEDEATDAAYAVV